MLLIHRSLTNSIQIVSTPSHHVIYGTLSFHMSAHSNFSLCVYCVFICETQLDNKLPGAETMSALFIAEYFPPYTIAYTQ